MAKNLYLLVGCSGSGKTTIAEEIEKQCGLKSIQSYTTRPKRTENETGHIFVTKDEFDNLSDKVAYTLFNDYEYCATAEQVDNSDLYVIDPKGIQTLKEKYKGNKKFYSIYIMTRLKDRYNRMTDRGDSCEKALERLVHDAGEFAGFEHECDFIVKNDNTDKLENVVESVWNFIESKENERN